MAERLPQYDYLRQRATQQSQADRDTQTEAMKRRFAANGMVNSGAYEKSAQIQDDDLNRQRNDAVQAVDFAEQNELQRQKEITEGRQFQTAERMGSQQFQSGEAGAQRGFMTAERLGGQDFAGSQAALQRRFQTGEREATQTFATGERIGGQDFSRGERQAAQLFNKELFDLDFNFKRQLSQNDEYWKKVDANFREKEFDESRFNNYINAYIALGGADIDNNQYNAIRTQLSEIGSKFGRNPDGSKFR